MPETEDKDEAGGTDEKKKRDRLAYIAVGIGAVGALIAFLQYHKSSSTSPAAYTYPAYGGTGAGTVAGASGTDAQSTYDQAIIEALAGLQQQISGGAIPASSRPGQIGATGVPDTSAGWPLGPSSPVGTTPAPILNPGVQAGVPQMIVNPQPTGSNSILLPVTNPKPITQGF